MFVKTVFSLRLLLKVVLKGFLGLQKGNFKNGLCPIIVFFKNSKILRFLLKKLGLKKLA